MLAPFARTTQRLALRLTELSLPWPRPWKPRADRSLELHKSLRDQQRLCFHAESKGASAKESAGDESATSNSGMPGAQNPSTTEQEACERPESPEKAGDTSAAAGDAQQLQQLEQMLQERNNELATLRERVIRLLAEMENVRMIARRDVEAARKYSISSFAKELLDVADNLNRALAVVPPEQLTATETTNSIASDQEPQSDSTKSTSLLRALHEGVSATERELQRTLQKFGIQRYGQVGEPFNPEVHQAVFEAPAPTETTSTADKNVEQASSPTLPDGAILHVLKAGYRIHDRVLRPAEVGVVKNPSPVSTPNPSPVSTPNPS
jgi:molecular chaperone GrpE